MPVIPVRRVTFFMLMVFYVVAGCASRRRPAMAGSLLLFVLAVGAPPAFAQEPQAPQPTVAPTTAPSPAPAPPDTSTDRRVSLRAGLNTRGPDESRVGITFSAEVASPFRRSLDVGIGVELHTFQAQTDSAIFTFMPVYWLGRYHALPRYRPAYLTAKLGFDLLGQQGDDTMSARQYYGIGVGLIPHSERAKSFHLELLYSRIRGSFPGIALSAGIFF